MQLILLIDQPYMLHALMETMKLCNFYSNKVNLIGNITTYMFHLFSFVDFSLIFRCKFGQSG